MSEEKVIKIYTMPLEYPCGPDSSCCGPVGQSEEEVTRLKEAIERETGLSCKVINIKATILGPSEEPVKKMLNTFGTKAIPIVTLNSSVVSMGKPSPEEIIPLIRQKISQ